MGLFLGCDHNLITFLNKMGSHVSRYLSQIFLILDNGHNFRRESHNFGSILIRWDPIFIIFLSTRSRQDSKIFSWPKNSYSPIISIMKLKFFSDVNFSFFNLFLFPKKSAVKKMFSGQFWTTFLFWPKTYSLRSLFYQNI